MREPLAIVALIVLVATIVGTCAYYAAGGV